jgi:hypothetical protein
MVEIFKEKKEAPEFVVASKLASPEYRLLLGKMRAYQKLFQYKYRENVSDLNLLCNLVGLKDVGEVVQMERILDNYLKSKMNGAIRSDLLEMVCPSCFQFTLTGFSHGEEIKKTCSECGLEVDESVSDIEDFSQFLDRDVTFAPTSALSYTGGKGGTYNPSVDLKQRNFFLNGIFNDANIDWQEFVLLRPDVADCFSDGTVAVQTETHVYLKFGELLRKVTVDDFYSHLSQLFHSFDNCLRHAKANRAAAEPTELKTALSRGLKLCRIYGFDNTDRDQAFYNTVGNEIRSMKRLVKLLRRKHVSEAQLVDTVFYLCLLKFDKKTVAQKAKAELNINKSLANLYFDFKDFLASHQEDKTSSGLLELVEQAVFLEN